MASAADIEYGLSLLKERQARDKLYRDYYSGEFRLAFASSSFREAFGQMFKKIGYNRCEGVVDALADRMKVEGWTVKGGGTKIEKNAMDLWDRNRMENRQNQVMKESFMTGDSYVIVWPDEDGLARFDVNASHLVTVIYDDERSDRINYAVKCWREFLPGDRKGFWRVTVYEADVVTRWITNKSQEGFPEKFGKLMPYEGDGQPETENPWGIIPVIHFGNDANIGSFGKSELLNVVPLQDGLNKSVTDMLVAGEFVSYPQRWAIGVDFDKDEESPFKPGMDRLWTVVDEGAKFGQFDSADMTQFIVVQDSWDVKIARVSRTPVHELNQSNIPQSGEALKTANDPAVRKAYDRIGCLTDPWSDVERLGLIQEGARPDEVAALTPTWKSPETRSEREFWTVAQMKIAAGVPEETVWKDYGYTPDEINEMKTIVAANRERSMVGIG